MIIRLLFYKFTIEIKDQTLQLTYGIGLIHFTFDIDQLIEAVSIKTPWYYGLGIRITPKGELYNIQGTSAVKIIYMSGNSIKSLMVGTPEPEQLMEALNMKFKKAD